MFDDIRLLTFDVVGTLIDFEAGILNCLRPLTNVPDEALLAGFARAEDIQQRRTPEMPFTQMLEPIHARMAAEFGLPAGSSLRESIQDWPAFPDAVEGLRVLGRRFRLVALTNADNWALAHMAATLGSPFDDAVTAEDVGVNKPDPRVFAYCFGRQSVCGYNKADWLHVAQSHYHDIGVAHRFGVRTCWVERRHGKMGTGATPDTRGTTTPDYHVTSLAGVVKLNDLNAFTR